MCYFTAMKVLDSSENLFEHLLDAIGSHFIRAILDEF
jgi:hypothetical protein